MGSVASSRKAGAGQVKDGDRCCVKEREREREWLFMFGGPYSILAALVIRQCYLDNGDRS